MKKFLKNFLILFVVLTVLVTAFFQISDRVNHYRANKNILEKLVNDVNSLIDNPEDKINSNDILWKRGFPYTTDEEGYLSVQGKGPDGWGLYSWEILGDPPSGLGRDKAVDHLIVFIQLNDFKRNEMTDAMDRGDYEENKKTALNFSYDYSFGNGYYIYYSAPTIDGGRIFGDRMGSAGDSILMGFQDNTIAPLAIYKLNQNLFSEDRNFDSRSSGMTILAIGDEKVKINPLKKYGVFPRIAKSNYDYRTKKNKDYFVGTIVNDKNFQKTMMEWDKKLNENIVDMIKFDAEGLAYFQLFLNPSSCSSLTGGDWAYPNFDNATAAFKFNSNNTFNYSNTYTNTTRYGTWKSIDDCSYQLKYRNGDIRILYISDNSFTIGSTKYKKY